MAWITFLNPSSGPAVFCGNTLTSQRLVDLLLRAFQAASGSQGCMDCFGVFGSRNKNGGFAYGYGETICGDEGAGPIWHGASGVQVHMANARTTDIETIERRYPILMREFSIRSNSGGKGKFIGECGDVGDFECRAPLTYSIISERRVNRPMVRWAVSPESVGSITGSRIRGMAKRDGSA